jgi:hypothetical protein
VKQALEASPRCDFLTNHYLKVELDSADAWVLFHYCS